jgi:prefoldin beta subunit
LFKMADISKESQEKIKRMQLLEQNMQSMLTQRQQFQQQLSEVESAINEAKDSKKTYKIIGGIMVSVDKDKLLKELEEKKEILSLRVKSLENQEDKLKEKAKKMQDEILQDIK